MLRPVTESAAHGLGEMMDVFGGVVPHGRQIVPLEDVEHLDQGDPAAGGRRHGDHVVPPIGPLHGRALPRLIAGQVFEREDAAKTLHLSHEEPSGLSGIEAIAPLQGDALQRAGEVGLGQPVTRSVRAAFVREVGHRPLVGGTPTGDETSKTTPQTIRKLEAVAGEPDCRAQEPLPVLAPVELMGLPKARHRARHTDGQRAVVMFRSGVLTRFVEPHLGVSGQRSLLPEIESGRGPVGETDHHESAAADVPGRGVRHGQRKTRGDGGVHGVAARRQDLSPSVAGVHGARHDHSIGRPNRSRRLGLRGQNRRRPGRYWLRRSRHRCPHPERDARGQRDEMSAVDHMVLLRR